MNKPFRLELFPVRSTDMVDQTRPHACIFPMILILYHGDNMCLSDSLYNYYEVRGQWRPGTLSRHPERGPARHDTLSTSGGRGRPEQLGAGAFYRRMALRIGSAKAMTATMREVLGESLACRRELKMMYGVCDDMTISVIAGGFPGNDARKAVLYYYTVFPVKRRGRWRSVIVWYW